MHQNFNTLQRLVLIFYKHKHKPFGTIFVSIPAGCRWRALLRSGCLIQSPRSREFKARVKRGPGVFFALHLTFFIAGFLLRARALLMPYEA